jgi:DNA repair exonuclease SbcCD ATPase subunit
MTRFFLSRVQVEGFRGINNENDPLDVRFRTDAVNSIFAPNGHCKSSLFEAISYAIVGTIPKLDRMPAAESPREYYVNKFHSKKCARVVLTLQRDDSQENVVVEVQRDLDGQRRVTSPSGHPDPEAILSSLRQSVSLLDSQTFAEFLVDSPLDRGRSFSSLLGLSKLSRMRQALEMISDTRAFQSDYGVKSLESDMQTAGRELQACLTILRKEYPTLTGEQLQDSFIPQTVSQRSVKALSEIKLLQSVITESELEQIDFNKISRHIADGAQRRSDTFKNDSGIPCTARRPCRQRG